MYCTVIFMNRLKLKADSRMRHVCFLLLFALISVLVLSVRFGAFEMNTKQFFSALFCKNGYGTETLIIYRVRAPRVVSALIAGVGLSLSGLLLQSVTGNSLAAPSVIGINSGAGLGVMIFLSLIPPIASIGASALMQLFAFLGALMTTIIVIMLSNAAGRGKSSIVLAGVAINAVFNAIIGAISLVDTDALASYNSFSIGGFSSCEYSSLIVPGAIVALCVGVAALASQDINLLLLGSGTAHLLGANVRRLRILCVITASAAAAAAVSIAGLIGFIGLVTPHISKKLVGQGFFKNLITTTLVGALVTTLADLLGRVLFSPTEIPVGIMMALVGAPFFIMLLFNGRREYL